MNQQFQTGTVETGSLEKEFLLKGVAVEPVLIKDQGEMAKLVFWDKQVTVPYTTQRVIKRLCQRLFLDLKSLQQCVGQRLHKKQLLPIPLTYEFVLFPLRTAPKDNVRPRGFLWVVHRQLSTVKPFHQSNQCELLFKNHYRITVPYSAQFIHRQMRDSYLVDYWFREAHHSFPRQDRPAISGLPASTSREALHMQLLQIAESLRKYPS